MRSYAFLGFSSFFVGFTRFYQIFHGFSQVFLTVHGVETCPRSEDWCGQPSDRFTRFSFVFLGFTRFYSDWFLFFLRSYQVLVGFTRFLFVLRFFICFFLRFSLFFVVFLGGVFCHFLKLFKQDTCFFSPTQSRAKTR